MSHDDVDEPPPFGLPLEMTRNPCDAISRRKGSADVPFAEQAPLLHTNTGSFPDGRVTGR